MYFQISLYGLYCAALHVYPSDIRLSAKLVWEDSHHEQDGINELNYLMKRKEL